MPEQELLVRIVGDDRSLQQAFTRSSRGAQQFETRTAKLGAGLTRGFAAAGLTVGAGLAIQEAKQLVDAASDLNEEITKSQQIFGDSADDIRSWSETTASAIGVSQRAALQASGVFGNLFTAVGIGAKDAAATSQQLVELGADLASFNNANIDDVFLALRSGLVGEAEPLRKFGILLSEARVQQTALTNTGKRSIAQLTNQEKAQARIQIIMQDSSKAQGDFARTSEGLANQQRIAAAESEDLAASIGGVLVPAEQLALIATIGLVGGLNNLIGGLKGLHERLRETDAFDGWNKGVENAHDGIGGFFGGLRDGIPLLDETIGKVRDLRELVQKPFDATPQDEFQQPTIVGPRGRQAAGDVAAEATASAKEAAEAIARATARANATLEQQIAAVAARIAHLKALIRADPSNAKLGQRLTTELEKQNTLLGQQRTLNENNARAAAAAAQTAHDASVRATQDQAAAAKAAADARRTRVQGKLFEAIGLTSEGDERAPGVEALRRRARALLEKIQGTDLDTAKNRSRIGAVLSSQFKKAGRDVRAAILAMFDEISSALDQGQKDTQKQQTKFRVVNTSQILSGIGLSEEETQRLRRRLSRVGAGGTIPQAGGAGGAFGLNPQGSGNTIVTGPITVVSNDPDDMGRKLDKNKRRTTITRTGHQAGRHK